MREVESQLGEHPSRPRIGRMVSCEEGLGVKLLECKRNNRSTSLLSQSATPIFRSKMKPKLVNMLIQTIGPQSSATGMLIGLQKKDRPVLDLIGVHGSNFAY